jgi:AcrR family transcriptional regulator
VCYRAGVATLTRVTDDDLDPRTRAAETKKRRTRERAINATLELFSSEALREREGLPTVENIAEEASIGVATLYTHFGTKYGLYHAALEQLVDPLVRPLVTAARARAYSPPDLRAEIISYVCRVAILIRNYRHLIAVYIQSYFESQRYEEHSGTGISLPITIGLRAMINFGQPAFSMRFSAHGVDQYMESLMLAAPMRNQENGLPRTTRRLARGIILDLLRSVDNEYTKDDKERIMSQVESLIPEEEGD